MKKATRSAGVVPAAIVDKAWQQVGASFDRFCLMAGLARISHHGRCIGPNDLVKFICNKELQESGAGSDADGVYLKSI